MKCKPWPNRGCFGCDIHSLHQNAIGAYPVLLHESHMPLLRIVSFSVTNHSVSSLHFANLLSVYISFVWICIALNIRQTKKKKTNEIGVKWLILRLWLALTRPKILILRRERVWLSRFYVWVVFIFIELYHKARASQPTSKRVWLCLSDTQNGTAQ